MEVLFDFPDSARLGMGTRKETVYEKGRKVVRRRVIPQKAISKEMIYRRTKPNARVKSYFVSDIDKIIWSYILAPRTINIPCKQYPKEIQILTVFLKTGRIRDEVLQSIDKTIPHPVIFILKHQQKVCYMLAYKRVSEADKNKRVISGYLRSGWLPESTGTMPLPIALDLSTLYEELIYEILSLSPRKNENIRSFIERAELLNHKEQEMEKLNARLKREIQFNRKVELNSKIKELQKDIETLRGV